MADYVVIDKEQLEADLTTVADSIRAKGGTTEPLAFPQGMKVAVENIQKAKEEQEKSISITENGTTEVIPDTGKVFSKVTVNIDVESGESEEFVGIKYSNFDSYRQSPKTADARSLPPVTMKMQGLNGGYGYLFASGGQNPNNGWHSMLEEVYLSDGFECISAHMFFNCAKLKNIHGDLSSVTIIGNNSFQTCKAMQRVPYMPNIDNISNKAFSDCIGLSSFCFYKTPTDTIRSTAFSGCTNLLDIYVPWSEGEVANAPWGATNATIHYNTVYDENHNPIIQEV